MKILLVEPDKILGGTIQDALELIGHDVLLRRNAQTALDSLDQTVPELIILELQLGVHNGIEFLYEVRSYAEWQHIPAIIHTINTKAQDKVFQSSLEQLGVYAVLYKPRTSTAQLVKTVKHLSVVV